MSLDPLTQAAEVASLEMRLHDGADRLSRALRDHPVTEDELAAYQETMAEKIEALRVGGFDESADRAAAVVRKVVERVRGTS